MEIIGWVRQGDKTACGGIILDGNSMQVTDRGKQYTVQGARVQCQKNCVIVQGHPTAFIDGKLQVIHGMLTSSGCPCISTLNDVSGVGNDGGDEIHPAFYPDDAGGWLGLPKHITPETSPLAKTSEETQRLLEQLTFVEVRLVNQQQEPIPNEVFTLTTPRGQVITGELDANGFARVDNVPRGDCLVEFKCLGVSYTIQS